MLRPVDNFPALAALVGAVAAVLSAAAGEPADEDTVRPEWVACGAFGGCAFAARHASSFAHTFDSGDIVGSVRRRREDVGGPQRMPRRQSGAFAIFGRQSPPTSTRLAHLPRVDLPTRRKQIFLKYVPETGDQGTPASLIFQSEEPSSHTVQTSRFGD